MDFEWTDAAIDRLKTLWENGVKTANIGREIGVSKNAVVGKVRRLGLIARPSPIKRGPVRAGAITLAALTSAQAPVSAPAAKIPPALFVPYVARRSRPCCWIFGEFGKPGFRFCEMPAPAGKSYCAEHAGLVYLPTSKKAPSPPADEVPAPG